MPTARSPVPPSPTTDALSAGDRRALGAILLAVGLATLDTAIANTALPAIAADLHAAPAASIWIINAYQLAVVATLLPFAALGDRIGPRRIYLAGLALFTVASLACALATTLPLLAAARALQGVGAGALMSVNIALIRLLYPPARLGRGVGLNALVVGVAFAIGPTIASLVLAAASWPWLFAINVPLGLIAFLFALPALPSALHRGHDFDPLTALLTAVTFAALILALGAAAQR
jgi:DHA2 family multidrug resistance protein-like MFS transporter